MFMVACDSRLIFAYDFGRDISPFSLTGIVVATVCCCSLLLEHVLQLCVFSVRGTAVCPGRWAHDTLFIDTHSERKAFWKRNLVIRVTKASLLLAPTTNTFASAGRRRWRRRRHFVPNPDSTQASRACSSAKSPAATWPLFIFFRPAVSRVTLVDEFHPSQGNWDVVIGLIRRNVFVALAPPKVVGSGSAQ